MEQIFELTDTYTSTSGLTNLWGKLWADMVIRYGEAERRFDQVAIINKDLVNSTDKTVYIPKTTKHLDMGTTARTEDADLGVRTTTALDSLEGVEIAMAASNFEMGAIGISREAAKMNRVNLVTEARNAIAQELSDNVDKAIATELQDTTVPNVVYGGDATAVDGLATGDVFNLDMIPDAMEKIESENFFPKYLFLHPIQIKPLRKDSQFISAAEYGDNRVVLKGEIGEYLGLQVIKTTNTPGHSSGATDTNESSKTWGATGKCGIMVGTGLRDQPVSVALAWKEMPTIGYEFDLKRNKHWIYHDQAYKSKIVQPKSVCLLKSSSA